METRIFNLLDAFNRNDLGNMYWQMNDFEEFENDTKSYFGTAEYRKLNKKCITVYGEGEALDCGINFQSCDFSMKLADSDVILYFWEL